MSTTHQLSLFADHEDASQGEGLDNSKFDWEKAKASHGANPDLALWLHLLYSIHGNSFGIPVAKFHALICSDESLNDFRLSLKLVLARCEAKGFLTQGSIDEKDFVNVEVAKRPTKKAKRISPQS